MERVFLPGFQVMVERLKLLSDRKPNSLPVLKNGMSWWVIESKRYNLSAKTTFRVFEAVIAHSEDQAISHAKVSDARLNAALMNAAIRRGEIEDQFEWQPISRLVEYLSIVQVWNDHQIENLDPVLLGMLQEHDFFLDEFSEDAQSAIGGGIYDYDPGN